MKKMLFAAALLIGASHFAFAEGEGNQPDPNLPSWYSYTPTPANCPNGDRGSEGPQPPCGPGITYHVRPSKLGVIWTKASDAQCYYPYTLASQGVYDSKGYHVNYFCVDPTMNPGGGNGHN